MDYLNFTPEGLLDFASYVSRMKMYPYFDVAHYIFMCLEVRADLATGR
jgi:hypothetical protein